MAYEPFGAVLRAGATRTHRLLRRTAAALLGGGSLWTLVVLASVAARAQSGPFLYVPNSSPNTVSVIDTSTNTTTSPAIPVGNGPINAAVSGDEALVYVTNSSSNTVSVINTATNTVVATINVGSTPVDAVVSPDGTRVYVTNINGNTVSVINTATNTVAATINVGSGPHDAVVSPDGTRVYVTNWNGLDVSVINTATNTVVATIINVGAGAGGAAVSPDGTRVYTANYNSNTVSVINTTTNTVVATINVGSQPSGVAVSPDGTRAYVTNVASNTVSVINTATNTVVATIINVVQPYFPGICSNGNALLATGLTFVARTSGALACTLASGPTGSPGPVLTGGTLQFAGAGIASALPISLQAAGGTFDTSGNNATLSGAISGPGSLTKIGVGTLTLDGTSGYTGATTVNAGTLLVNGDISSSSGVTVNFGGTLGGSGTVSPTTINSGGTLAPGSPGTTLNVAGNLAFQPGSLYLVQVGPSSGSNANVTGSATLTDGSVQTVFTSGNNVLHSYDILHATVGLSGTTFSGVSGNVPTNFTESLSYTATDVFLNLTAALGAGGSLSGNQQNVAGAINSFFNNGGTLPPGFLGLFNLTGPNLANALTLLSGEAATGAQTGAFQLMNSFLGLMVDQSLDAGNGNGAPAMPIKAPPARSSQPWSAWGSAYGGTDHANGDATVVGSHDVRTNTWGIAAGLDYRLSPDTKIGFALGGAGTNWGLSDGLGGGKSDAFQAGIYGLTRSGPAYLSGALAFSSYWVSTDRVAFASDQLTANFNAYGIGGRLEGGYRFATPVVGFTPYAALQAQSFHIPSYSETDVTGGGFGLAYNAHTASDTRSELGARLDKQIALDNGAVLALRGRAAWAHDWVTDPSLTAAFLALPGGGTFIVNGATPAHNSALVTAGAEIKLRSGWSVMAKFDGEFASGSQTYIGTGKLRYSW